MINNGQSTRWGALVIRFRPRNLIKTPLRENNPWYFLSKEYVRCWSLGNILRGVELIDRLGFRETKLGPSRGIWIVHDYANCMRPISVNPNSGIKYDMTTRYASLCLIYPIRQFQDPEFQIFHRNWFISKSQNGITFYHQLSRPRAEMNILLTAVARWIETTSELCF